MGCELNKNSISALPKNDSPNHFCLQTLACASSLAQSPRVPDVTTARIKNRNTLLAEGVFVLWWAIRDSNPGPTGYEPVALTN